MLTFNPIWNLCSPLLCNSSQVSSFVSERFMSGVRQYGLHTVVGPVLLLINRQDMLAHLEDRKYRFV